MLDLNKLGCRIDINAAAELIGLSLGKQSVSRKTVYTWVKKGHFPQPLKVPNGAAVWDTEQCLEALGLVKPEKAA